MIRAKHHNVLYPFFKWLTRFLLKRNFHALQIEGAFHDNGRSVLVVANHISWWDGFWMEYLNQKIIHRRFHFMMLEEQLKKHWYFQYTGGFSVNRNSREIVESIDYAVDLLNKDDNLVLMFPQGRIHSAHDHAIQFEQGIQHIVKKCADDTQVVFVASFTDYFSNAKPGVFIYTETWSAASLKERNLKEEYQLFFSSALSHHHTKVS